MPDTVLGARDAAVKKKIGSMPSWSLLGSKETDSKQINKLYDVMSGSGNVIKKNDKARSVNRGGKGDALLEWVIREGFRGNDI